ncbi:unnamed protein product [Psylliodes chrysocephalus]|uniref:Uncharacterized protein n=1 Tax=Psylliodes chrysocephalus TaxID=3402493 RepID=A0A9P0GFU3_9CUCU|nr:unnamed protein product [Psylliodes chrysocephala]
MLSDSESEDDPFGGTGTDSDEDYVGLITNITLTSKDHFQQTRLQMILMRKFKALELTLSCCKTSEDGSDQIPGILENTPQRGKKGLVRKQSWKRNIQKARRTKGKPYINVAGIHKPGKHIGSNCHCKLKCFDEIVQ